METKKCTYCLISKPISEYTKNNKSKDRLQYYCIDCGKAIKRKWRIKNKDKHDLYMETYRNNNRQIIRKRGKNFRLNNIEKERIRCNEYKKKNPHRRVIWEQTRNALKINALHPNLDKTIENIIYETGQRISKCVGIKFNVDHILPLSKGGYHHHLNLQLIPEKLNVYKHNNLDYKHELLIHWTELPDYLLDKLMD